MTSSAPWDPAGYLRFGDERARPFSDLLARVGAREPRTETHGSAQERIDAFERGGTDGVRACLPNSVG